MSPEQIEGKRGDQRTDVYAVGIMLYELIKGEVPFHGDNNLAVMAQHLQGAIPRLDKEVAGISPQLAAVVAKCLQRDPATRYGDMSQFLYDLENLDKVDISVLDKFAGPNSKGSFLHNPAVKAVGSALLLLIVIIILAIILQALKR